MEGARSLNVSKFPGEPSAVMSEKLKFLNLGQCGAQKKKRYRSQKDRFQILLHCLILSLSKLFNLTVNG